MIRCKDGSLYTGLTDDVQRRFREHLSGKGSFYTKHNSPVEVAYVEECSDILEAERREKQIKGWTRRKKEALIYRDLQLLKRL